MNSVIEAALSGRVVKVGELRQSKAGKPWCSLSVAVGTGDDTQWVSVVTFGADAETVSRLEKGAAIYVEGKIALNTWSDGEGKERSGLKLAASLVQPLNRIGNRRPQKPRQNARAGQGSPDIASARDWQRPPATAAGGAAGGLPDDYAQIPF